MSDQSVRTVSAGQGGKGGWVGSREKKRVGQCEWGTGQQQHQRPCYQVALTCAGWSHGMNGPPKNKPTGYSSPATFTAILFNSCPHRTPTAGTRPLTSHHHICFLPLSHSLSLCPCPPLLIRITTTFFITGLCLYLYIILCTIDTRIIFYWNISFKKDEYLEK